MTPDDRLKRIVAEGKCIGCGLCASMLPDKLKMGLHASGYLRPELKAALNDDESNRIYEVCPGVIQTGLPSQLVDQQALCDDVWGQILHIERVFATDAPTRHRAATGGSLTALAQYLLDSGTVQHVLHVAPGGAEAWQGSPSVSDTRGDVTGNSGSCYAPAAPLARLHEILELGEPFAVVAKPCDISAVRLLAGKDQRIDKLMTHCLTMVCGGIMPPFAMLAFLNRHGIPPEKVVSVSYRGNGCPGPTRVELADGQVIEKTYTEFWGEDSSMWHLPWRCKICPDGCGEAADIAAADTWPGGSPTPESMLEDPGTNVVIARTERGVQLLRDAKRAGFLSSDGVADVNDLNNWQPHQVRKKFACEARYDGMESAGQLRIETPGMRTSELASRIDREKHRHQVSGTRARIAIGKHRDDYRT